jgi:hypothetical protein
LNKSERTVSSCHPAGSLDQKSRPKAACFR